MKTFTKEEYKNYLQDLVSSVFKILPLYEDENEFLSQYIASVIIYDVQGSYELIQEHEYKLWYHKTLTTLNGLKKSIKDSETTHSQIKGEVFKLTNLLSQNIKELGE